VCVCVVCVCEIKIVVGVIKKKIDYIFCYIVCVIEIDNHG